MTGFVGEIAALVTAVAWALTGVFFTLAGRRVGAWVVNVSRLLLALLMMFALHRVTLGTWIPADAEPFRWRWLLLSGVLGLALGDASLFQSLVYIGPRLASLLMATVPIMSTLIAWVFLGERLVVLDVVAVLLTSGGVAWVVMERNVAGEAERTPKFWLGVLFGLGGALGQTLGLITSKLGLAGEFSAISANVIRMLGATVALWSVALLAGQGRRVWTELRRHPQAVRAIVAGAIAGPVVGVILSLVAIQRAPVGIASTLMALTPIAVLPLVHWFFAERISRRALGGTFLAVAGVALIFLF